MEFKIFMKMMRFMTGFLNNNATQHGIYKMGEIVVNSTVVARFKIVTV
jgi:hypothetical protein